LHDPQLYSLALTSGVLKNDGRSFPRAAARAAIAGPLSDDPAVTSGLVEMIDVYLTGQV
jgi:nitric oxide reductase NorQ protein